MKILFASRNYFPKGAVGGAQTSIKFLAQAFQSEGHDVAVLSVDDHGHTGVHLPTGIAEFRIKINGRKASGGTNPIDKVRWHGLDRFGKSMQRAYRSAIESYAPDVIFTHVLAGLTTRIWDAARDANVPIVHMVHDYYLLCIKSGMRKNGNNCAHSCMLCDLVATRRTREQTKAVSQVIYVSDHVKQKHEEAGLFSTSGSHIIHGSYEPARAIPNRLSNISPTGPVLGYFGRIAPDKGVAELIGAMRTLEDVPWRLVIGGSGPEDYVSQLKRQAKGLPIEFVGVQAPDDFYAKIDAIVVPSLWNDSAPRVVYEAGIHGVAPLVSDRGGLPQLVAYGKRGRIFDISDPESLRREVRYLAKNPAEIDRIRSEWSEAASQFTQVKVSQDVLNVLRAAQNLS